MERFFSSDLHFGHTNVIEYSGRPHASTDEMNANIIERWNTIVHPDDEVFVLGDVALGKLGETLPLVAQLNGRKLLLPGNHDRCWHGHRKTGTWEQRYQDYGFAEVLTDAYEAQSVILSNGQRVLLCHFPYIGDHSADIRFEEHRLDDDHQTWILHGHVHEAWRQRGRQINVGIDAWGGYPVHEAQILYLISQGPQDLDRIEW